MYSLEQRLRAVELYIQYGFHGEAVRRELGYPRSAQSIVNWYHEYKEQGFIHDGRISNAKYSKEQRNAAVRHFLEHGKNYSYTRKQLGYPSRQTLRIWVAEDAPDEAPSYCRKSSSSVYLSQQQKEQAVIDLCSRDGTAQGVADRYGVSRYTLYEWKRQLFDRGATDSMPKKPDDVEPTKQQPNSADELRDMNKELEQLASDLQKQNEDLRKEAEDLQKQVYRLRLERDVLEKAAEIIKKDQGVSLKTLTNREKAIVIDALKDRYPLKDLLSVFQMARSSYYYQEVCLRTPDKYEDLRETIRIDFSSSGGAYGYRRIHQGLKNRGEVVSEKVVRRIMREEHLVVPTKKRRKYNSYKGEISPAVPNVINRDFHADAPNRKWLTDITEFHIPAGKIYLSPIIDCFDGLPVSWAIGTSPDAELVNTMLDEAISTLSPDEHPIVHSDRGCHYRWPGWIERMEKAGLTRSMSKKGYSPDNSACEGFFGRLKNEMFYGRGWWKDVSIQEFIDRLDAYIHWYAEDRIKISLGGLSPIAYRRKLGLVA